MREYWKYLGLLFKIVFLCIIDSGSFDLCIFRELKIIYLVSEDGLFLLLNKILCDYEVFGKRNEFFVLYFLFLDIIWRII